MKSGLLLVASVLTLAACGAPSMGGGEAGRSAANCPPERKGDGLMVGQRYDYEDLMRANRWRAEMFPSSCAGSLAMYVPDMPEGFGVMPTHKPFIMNDNQVHLIYAEMPETLYNEDDIAITPMDMERIEFEIVRFTSDEMKLVQDWMSENPNGYLSGNLNGTDVYLIGGFGTGRQGKGDRLATSLHAFLPGDIVVRVSHKSLFSQRGGLELSPLVETVLGDILERAEGA